MSDDAATALRRAMEAYRQANIHKSDELDAAFEQQPPVEAAVAVEPEQVTFDLPLGEAQASEGMAHALTADRVQAWKIAASAWLDALPSGAEVHMDLVTAAVGLPDEGANRNNVTGAWLNAQAKGGRLTFTGKFRKSQRPERHGSVQRVWRKR